MPNSHETLSDDTFSPRSGSSSKYEWIWDCSRRAERLPSSSAPPTPEHFTSDEEDAHFVRRGGCMSDCAQMRALRDANRDQEIEIEILRDAVSIYRISKEVVECINIVLEEQVEELQTSNAAMYNKFVESRQALTEALATSTDAGNIMAIMVAIIAILIFVVLC